MCAHEREVPYTAGPRPGSWSLMLYPGILIQNRGENVVDPIFFFGGRGGGAVAPPLNPPL